MDGLVVYLNGGSSRVSLLLRVAAISSTAQLWDGAAGCFLKALYSVLVFDDGILEHFDSLHWNNNNCTINGK
eukprot:m.221377 g.221377  ORF g.221377 m.221377 type:complete len:72 (+) comp19186_c0_seq9:100-315(+)